MSCKIHLTFGNADSYLQENGWKVRIDNIYAFDSTCYRFTKTETDEEIVIHRCAKERNKDEICSKFRYCLQKTYICGDVHDNLIYKSFMPERYYFLSKDLKDALTPELFGNVIWYIYSYDNNFLSIGLRQRIKNEYELYLERVEQQKQLKCIMYELYVLVDVANIMIEYV